MKRFALPTLVLVLSIPTSAQAGQHRDLCASVPGACEYTGPDAPWLHADVCRDETGLVTLKGAAVCAAGSWPYHLDFGELVDPLTGEIAGYVPLDWACDHSGICVEGPAPSTSTTQALCCEWGACFPLVDVICNSDAAVAVMCKDGVTNEDGTITCFEGNQI